MVPSRRKTCPSCGTHAAIDDVACGGCGHAYRTRFAPTPPPAPLSPASSVPRPPPPSRPTAGAGTSPPLEWSDAYAASRRRMKWVWAIGGTIVGFKVLSLVAPLALVLVASHWERKTATEHADETTPAVSTRR